MSISDGFNLWVGRALAELAIAGAVLGVVLIVGLICVVFRGRK